mmetsp:Transcript_86894/g.225750  ORF Transcript_86894/g.225750 Transcript_86894/m.225750 type:complete len:234 (+) Transcript_86894:66-767(+)
MSSPGSPSPRYATALSTCKSSPKFSFRGRPGNTSKNDTPGPGAYSHPSPAMDKYNAQPSHGFGTAQRDRTSAAGVPGPGQYKPHDPRVITIARCFGTSPRQSIQPARVTTVGPGQYNSAEDKTMGSFGPKYSAAPRPAERRSHDTPGPGAYHYESDQMVASSQQRRPRSPKWGFGTSPRDNRSMPGSPGPGAYNSENDMAGPKFTMRSKWDRKQVNDTPGPGAYDSNVTCFGY